MLFKYIQKKDCIFEILHSNNRMNIKDISQMYHDISKKYQVMVVLSFIAQFRNMLQQKPLPHTYAHW